MNIASLSAEGRTRYKKVICEQLWLEYYNDTLRQHRIIAEKVYLKMHEAILIRTEKLLKGVQ